MDETECPLREISCPHCNSRDVVRINSYIRDVQDLGGVHRQKLLRFESITLKCKSCGKNFHLENEKVLKGSRYTKAVLEVCLLLVFEDGFSARGVKEHLNRFYKVSIDRSTILKWAKVHGKPFCEARNLEYQKNLDEFSGFLSLDGTFSKFQPKRRYKRKSRGKGKKKDSWLHLTRLPDGTLLATWEVGKTKTKS
ncbi:MAG: hypothetical protein ACTSRW_16585 [Candidatus Helarchaeota archaeon]